MSVSADDISTLMHEMDLDRAAADHALREHGGSLEVTLNALIRA